MKILPRPEVLAVSEAVHGAGQDLSDSARRSHLWRTGHLLLSGLNPGSPKLCGLEIVSGRHLPDDFLLGT